jgi:hypothetical protein
MAHRPSFRKARGPVQSLQDGESWLTPGLGTQRPKSSASFAPRLRRYRVTGDAYLVAARSPTGMLGQNPASRIAGQFSFAPPIRCYAVWFRCSGICRQHNPGRSRYLAAAFHSPTGTARFRTATVTSTLLAYYFGTTSNRRCCPFGPELLSPHRGAGAINVQNPLPLSDSTLLISFRAAAPLRGLHPSGS